MSDPKYEKHCITEEQRLQAVMAERARMIPELQSELANAHRRIQQLEWELNHRMERAIDVLRGIDYGD